MSRKPKCKICGVEIDKEIDEWERNSTGYFHKTCKKERDDLRKNKIVTCLVCGKTINRQTDEYKQILGGYAHKNCDIKEVDENDGIIKTIRCHYCDQPIIASQAERAYGKNFHADCLPLFEDRRELYRYICRLWGLKSVGPTIARQIKNFKDKGYTYKGMMYSLKYFFEIKQNNNDKYKGRETVGIIPYVYEDARKYYAEIVNRRNQIANDVLQQEKQKSEVRHIKSKQKPKFQMYEF